MVAFNPEISPRILVTETTPATNIPTKASIDGISANTERLRKQTGSFVGVITALIPHIGYGPAAQLAKQALAGDLDIAELVVASGLLTRDEVRTLLAVEHLTGADRKH